MTSYNKEKWIWECPVCALSPPPIHPLSVYLLFHPLWLWYPKNNNNNSCEKTLSFHSTSIFISISNQHNCILFFSHHHCCIHPTLPFLPSHISSPATSSSSECASSLSPRKLQLYPSCRQPLLVSRWTIHNFDPHSLTDCQCPVWWPT